MLTVRRLDSYLKRCLSQEDFMLWPSRATALSPVNISSKFTLREFTVALQQLKPGKAPGPDSIRPELVPNTGAALKS